MRHEQKIAMESPAAGNAQKQSNMHNLIIDQQFLTPKPQEHLRNGNDILLAIGHDTVDVFVDVIDMPDLAAVDITFR